MLCAEYYTHFFPAIIIEKEMAPDYYTNVSLSYTFPGL